MTKCQKLTSVLLAVLLMLTCSGCLTKLPEEPEENPPGRYVESSMGNPGGSMPFACGEIDGELYAITSTGLYQSRYSGAAWSAAWTDSPILHKAQNEWTITAGCFTPDGTIIVCESIWGEPDENGQAFAEDIAFTEISSDGSERSIDITLPEDDMDIDGADPFADSITNASEMLVAPDGSLLIRTNNGSLHRFDRESGELLLTYSSDFHNGIETFAIVGDTLVTIGGMKGSALYEYKTGELLDNDMALNEFVTGLDEEGKPIQRQNEYGMNVMGSRGRLFTYPEDQDEYLYISSTNGIYRHKLMGNIIQQLVSGELCSLFNPSCSVKHVCKTSDGRFIAACLSTGISGAGPGVLQYVYDPDLPFFPDVILKVYALWDDQSLQEAIAVYQKEHPDVYLVYEVGMNFGAGITLDDALRNLNADIMNDEAPDIFLLNDYMPLDSYFEKGLLMDLTEFRDELVSEEKLFENILNSYQRDDGIFALTTNFEMPLMFAQEDVIANSTDLESLVDEIVRLREENPHPEQDSITGIMHPHTMLRVLFFTCAPKLQREDGSVDREALTEFLRQGKRAWDAEQLGRGYDPDRFEFEINVNPGFFGAGVRDGSCLMTLTTVDSGDTSFASMIATKNNFDGYDYKLMPGMSEKVFIPARPVGISASTEQPEVAKDFLKTLFSVTTQSSDMAYIGLPVNREALNEQLNHSYSIGQGPVTMYTPEGESVDVIPYIALPRVVGKDYERLFEMIDSLETPVIPPDVLSQNVYNEYGPAYLHGEMTLEDAVESIIAQVDLYLAEQQ